MTRSQISGLLLGAVLLVAGAAAPAGAETVGRNDPLRDAPPTIDVARATYTHDQRRISVTADLPGLGTSGTAVLRITRFGIFEAGYVVQVKARPGQPARTSLGYFNHFDVEPRRCPGVTGSWGRQEITLSVPRSCLEGHRRERVFTQFGIQRAKRIDNAPAVRRLRRG